MEDQSKISPRWRSWFLGVLTVISLGGSWWLLNGGPYPEPVRASLDLPDWYQFWDVAPGLAFLLGSVWLWAETPPRTRLGALFFLYGSGAWLAVLTGSRIPLVYTLGSAFRWITVPIFLYLFLAYPEQHLRQRGHRIFIGVIAGLALYEGPIGAMFYDPSAFGCPNCQPNLNLLLVHSLPEFVDRVNRYFIYPVFAAASVYAAGTLIVRFLHASRFARRVYGWMLMPAILFACAQAAFLVYVVVGTYMSQPESPTAAETIVRGTRTAELALPVAFLLGRSRLKRRRARVGDLIIDLRTGELAGELQQALARVLGDPGLVVALWDAEKQTYVDHAGVGLVLPGAGDERAATFLRHEDGPMAVIVHDRALLEDQRLVAAVQAATELAFSNDRLQSELRRQLEEVQDSRRRIVEAGEDARKKVERDLHDGAQQRLLNVKVLLALAANRAQSEGAASTEALGEVVRELDGAMEELRDLARGVHPALLTDGGLEPAIRELAARSPGHVALDVRAITNRRFAPEVESAAYFVVSEALANATKHSGAARISVHVDLEDQQLRISVDDDGIGGARIEEGTGLGGLADRVDVLGGALSVESPPGRGTFLRVSLPAMPAPTNDGLDALGGA